MKLQTNHTEAVGLFGTCGKSTWREPYYSALSIAGIPLFDPQIEPETHGRSWCEEDIQNEVKHLESNPILMFKVTGETTGLMSLLEIVKSIQEPTRYIIVLIEPLNVDHKAASSDPRLQAITEMLLESGMKVPNIIKDVHNARQWTTKAIMRASEASPLVYRATNDQEAIKMIKACYQVVQLKT